MVDVGVRPNGKRPLDHARAQVLCSCLHRIGFQCLEPEVQRSAALARNRTVHRASDLPRHLPQPCTGMIIHVQYGVCTRMIVPLCSLCCYCCQEQTRALADALSVVHAVVAADSAQDAKDDSPLNGLCCREDDHRLADCSSPTVSPQADANSNPPIPSADSAAPTAGSVAQGNPFRHACIETHLRQLLPVHAILAIAKAVPSKKGITMVCEPALIVLLHLILRLGIRSLQAREHCARLLLPRSSSTLASATLSTGTDSPAQASQSRSSSSARLNSLPSSSLMIVAVE